MIGTTPHRSFLSLATVTVLVVGSTGWCHCEASRAVAKYPASSWLSVPGMLRSEFRRLCVRDLANCGILRLNVSDHRGRGDFLHEGSHSAQDLGEVVGLIGVPRETGEALLWRESIRQGILDAEMEVVLGGRMLVEADRPCRIA